MADKPNGRTSAARPATIDTPVALVTCWAKSPVAQQAMTAFNLLGKGAMPVNVRVQPESHAQLREMADCARTTMADVLAEAIDELYRKRFIEKCDLAYSRLRAEPEAWQEMLRERQEWDRTLKDGLEDA